MVLHLFADMKSEEVVQREPSFTCGRSLRKVGAFDGLLTLEGYRTCRARPSSSVGGKSFRRCGEHSHEAC